MGIRKANDHHFPGLIDDVAIFSSALSNPQIIQLMTLGGASFIGDPTLVALWELDESSGYTASDSSGNGNHGTLNDPPVWQPSGGQLKGALDFDGKDDLVDNGKTASQLGIGGNSPRTVTAWVFTRSFNNGGIYEVGQGGTDGADFSLRTEATDDHWRVQYWGNAFDADFTYASKNRWVHFAHVHDGSSTKVYADGQQVVNVPRTLNTADNKTFKIGKWTCGPAANPQWAAYFDGLIDDVRIYDRALDQEEIKSLSGTAEDIYWLSIAAVYPQDVGPFEHLWGWKTRPESWMDDAVRFELFEQPTVGTVTDPHMVIPIEDPRTGESFDVAFELDTDPNWVKWEQPFTGIRRWPHYEDELSKAVADPAQDTIRIDRLVADDWRCDQNTPVTAAVWWGSYIGYEYQACQEQLTAPPAKPDYFWLAIWDDIPEGADPQVPYSHPNDIIWQYSAYDYDEVMVGYDKHPHLVGPDGLTGAIHGASTSIEVEVGPEANINESVITAQYAGEPALPPASALAATTMAFPSASSTVVANVGFINATEIGYFWSVARGDSVTETLPTSEPSVNRAIFDFVVPTNALVIGYFVHWDVLINGVPIGSFTVVDGQTGPVHLDFSFPPIGGPNYTIRFRVTNEVPAGCGSHSLGYAGIHAGTVQLLGETGPKEPVFRYSVRLPKHAWFQQEEPNDIYWLSVVAVYNADSDPLYDWGWTNHKHVFNDDAVAGYPDPGAPEPTWQWEELYDQTEESEDMSFMLFTEPCLTPGRVVGGNYITPDMYHLWVSLGKPECWCCPCHSRGDANCDCRINAIDVFALRAAWP
ncbi:MAG: LamG domain-containing protein, partial [Phycisphaerales bacterium]